ncbi:uncharacterized protein [Antedon mediterranea]|uniref:uncharacterized protein n=1 Tax=Antedon mediterranea TaxID=105859 RepID=UPI003AF740C5
MAEENERQLKRQRRNAKAKFTRLSNAMGTLIERNRPKNEINEAFLKVSEAYESTQTKHDQLMDVIEDDEDCERQEKWMLECQDNFLELSIRNKEYHPIGDDVDEEQEADQQDEQNDIPDQEMPEQQVGAQGAEENLEANQVIVDGEADRGQAIDGNNENVAQGQIVIKLDENDAADTQMMPSNPSSRKNDLFKIERPKLPKFSGDVRDYYIFRADFRQFIESRYSNREAVTILRSSLQGKPLELIRGLGEDYRAAWSYLDNVYGDPRFIADAIAQDINKFKPLKEGEENRFCELTHLINRSYNTLKEAGRPNDMDNNHVLAMIEQKLSIEDKKVWFRHLDNKEATLNELINWMMGEMKSRMRATAQVRSNSTTKVSQVNQVAATKRYKCWICSSDSHWTDKCNKLKEKTPQERLNEMKAGKACFGCLKKGHGMSVCNRRRQCSQVVKGAQCKYFHHPLLHIPEGSQAVTTTSIGNSSILPVLVVEVLGRKDTRCQANVLLDSGAQISLIRSPLAEQLHLKGKEVVTTIKKVGGEEEQLFTKIYKTRIRPMRSKQEFIIKAIGIPSISDDVEEICVADIARRFKIDTKDIYRGHGDVDLLIGIDHPNIHIGETREAGNLIARNSPLGWVIFGAVTEDRPSNNVLHVKFSQPVDLTDFWTTEAMGVTVKTCSCEASKIGPIESEEAKIIADSCTKLGNQWLIPYPWKRDPNQLPNNRSQAEKKLYSMERRLLKNPEHAKAYKNQIKEMVDMKFARKLSDKELSSYGGPVHYISHHGVLRPDKKSTPLRIVFNSSAMYQGHCLNEYWMKGPDMLNDLFGVILRFRENETAIIGDISKMYHRVLIPIRDQHVHRFLWRNLNIDSKIDVYLKTVLTFGDKPSSAMAQTALRKTAEEGRHQFPKAAQVLKRNTYMDDICESVTTVDEAKVLTKNLDNVLKKGGFKVKGWLSNKNLTSTESDREVKIKLLQNSEEEKVLGTVWEPISDKLKYRVNIELNNSETMPNLTKRKILSQIAKIFDPIGFAAAFLIRAKIGMQHLWQKGYDWDEDLPTSVQDWWVKLFKEMKELNTISFDRCLTPPTTTEEPILCMFADASEDAFGSCAYIRWKVDNNQFDVKFVAAKSRVTPLKKLTIPRLELQAALVATRLHTIIIDETRIKFNKVIFLTDSMIVLAWIRSQARGFKSFVSNRIGEIQSMSEPSQWRHVPGEHNVADDVSRGIPVKQLNGRWRIGPEFLYLPEED